MTPGNGSGRREVAPYVAVPGAELGIAWRQGLALVDASVGPAVASRLWEVMAGGGDLAAFVRHLGAGRPPESLPSFALALAHGAPADGAAVDVCLAARGRFVAAASAATDQAVSGADATTWSDRAVTAATRFSVRSVAQPAAVATDPLPLVGGVVVAQRLQTAAWLQAAPSSEDTPESGTILRPPTLLGAAPDVRRPASAAPGGRRLPPVVPALVCPHGHANPPATTTCGRCGEPVAGPPTTAARPPLGRLVVSTGEVVELTDDTVVGRAPRAERPGSPPAGRLVVLPEAHVSAVHLEIRLQGWSVLVLDRRSTNGTYLLRSGRAPERLVESPQELVPGDVLDLGHGAHVAFQPLTP